MIILDMFVWWYGAGWKQVVSRTESRFLRVLHLFSVPILLRTLFSPWRRIISYPSASLQAKFRAAGDNLVSRMVGFSVRASVLIGAAGLLSVMAVISVLQIVLWPLLPLSIGVLIVLGIVV